MKGKAFIPLVLGLVVGLFAVKVVVDTVRKSQANQKVATATVVRAKTDIRAFTAILPDDVEEVQVADSGLAPKSERVEKKDDVVGRVTAKSIPMGVPVLQSMLSPPGTRPGIVGRIPPGFRAVAVEIDEATTAGYQIQPGDWVDVIVVMDVKSGTRRGKETIAEVLLQRVEVGAVGQGALNVQDGNSGGKVKPAKTATLLVKEEDSPKLHLAATRGKITLSLRGKDEEAIDNAHFVTNQNLLNALMGREVDVDETPTTPTSAPTAMLASDRRAHPKEVPFDVVIRRGSDRGEVIETITFESKESMNIIGVTKGVHTPSGPMSQSSNPFGIRRPAPGVRGPVGVRPETDPAEDQDFDAPHE